MYFHVSRVDEPDCVRVLEDMQGASVASTAEKWIRKFLSLAVVESVAVAGCCLKHPALVTVSRIRGDLFVFMEKSDWVAQAAMGCSRSRPALATSRSLEKLRMLSNKALEEACGMGSALADDPMQALEEHVGAAAVMSTCKLAKRRRLASASLTPGFVNVPVANLAPEGHSPVQFDAHLRVYALPRQTTTAVI